MSAKPRRYPKEENFRRLPADKATRSLINAMLDMRDPVPWNKRPIPDVLPPLAKLARRIEQEADAGRNVRLKSETAKKVALALYTVADGPIPWEGLRAMATVLSATTRPMPVTCWLIAAASISPSALMRRHAPSSPGHG